MSASDVVELDPSDPRATVCGHCGRGWDDTVSTSCTPVPNGRCPFEYEHEHEHEPDKLARQVDTAWELIDDALSAAVGARLTTGDLLDYRVGGWNAYGKAHTCARDLSDALELALRAADELRDAVQEVTETETETETEDRSK